MSGGVELLRNVQVLSSELLLEFVKCVNRFVDEGSKMAVYSLLFHPWKPSIPSIVKISS